MDLALFREDTEKQKGGAPVYIGDATFYLRRWGTPESQRVLKDLRRSLFGPHHKSQESDESLLLAHWLADYGCVSWEGVESDGGDLKYSAKAARGVFLNEEYFLSLNVELFLNAQKFENYLYDEATEEVEELKKP